MNYYEILEVSVNASKEVIKNAYRALSKKYHPDSYDGDKEFAQNKMKEINTAYETLIDDDKRLLYDYDNGFKVDPNAPVEDVDSTKVEVQNTNIRDEEKDSSKHKINKSKIIIIGGVVIIALFFIAFYVGGIIAGEDKKENDEENKTKIEYEKNNTKEEKNNNYSYNNNSYSNENNITNIKNKEDNEIVKEPIDEEVNKEDIPNDITKEDEKELVNGES